MIGECDDVVGETVESASLRVDNVAATAVSSRVHRDQVEIREGAHVAQWLLALTTHAVLEDERSSLLRAHGRADLVLEAGPVVSNDPRHHTPRSLSGASTPFDISGASVSTAIGNRPAGSPWVTTAPW